MPDDPEEEEEIQEETPTAHPSWLTVGQRVLLDNRVGGMIAVISDITASAWVATDEGKWQYVLRSHIQKRLMQEEAVPTGPGKVVALDFNSCGYCMGMFMGFENETVFQQEANAYLAHVARPSFDSRTKIQTRGTKAVGYTFTAGELVQQRAEGGGPPGGKAVVVRVVHKPKMSRTTAAKGQARKLLILFEVWPDGSPPSGVEPQFFPGSWTSWERVPQSRNGWTEDIDSDAVNAPCMRLRDEDYANVEKV